MFLQFCYPLNFHFNVNYQVTLFVESKFFAIAFVLETAYCLAFE